MGRDLGPLKVPFAAPREDLLWKFPFPPGTSQGRDGDLGSPVPESSLKTIPKNPSHLQKSPAREPDKSQLYL